jgi:hypothetical protein
LIGALGWSPTVSVASRPARRAPLERAEFVAFVRQRLCLPESRDPDVDAALGDDPRLSNDEVYTVAWSGPT